MSRLRTADYAPEVRPGAELSGRELEVLARLAAGETIAEAAAALYITAGTVKTHQVRIFDKLGARNRAHAVALAYRAGVLVAAPPSTVDIATRLRAIANQLETHQGEGGA